MTTFSSSIKLCHPERGEGSFSSRVNTCGGWYYTNLGWLGDRARRRALSGRSSFLVPERLLRSRLPVERRAALPWNLDLCPVDAHGHFGRSFKPTVRRLFLEATEFAEQCRARRSDTRTLQAIIRAPSESNPGDNA
jgi:hypothetical protein